MPQSPFLVDALQIEPGSGDTITISRNASDGTLKFVDTLIAAGVVLPELIGLRKITGVFLVGRAGDGAPYTTIQSALDAVPDSSSQAAPSIVLVMPGAYTENLTIEKDGVCLVSVGGVRVLNSGANHTVTIAASIDSTPLFALLRGIEIENGSAGYACVRILGADTFATGTVTVDAAPLAAGDVLTIAGFPLTGVSATRTSGANNFAVTGGTPTAVAAEIAAAINDSSNSFATLVEATVIGAVITLTAVTAGSGGNAITLAQVTVPVNNLTLSGANLTGGSSAGSLVGSEVITLEDCVLQATGVGSYQILVDTVNYVDVRGGTWRGSSSTSLTSVTNASAFRLFGVDWVNDLNLSYDTGVDRPSDLSSSYEIRQIGRVQDVIASLEGAGALLFGSCSEVGDLTVGGGQTLDVRFSTIGTLTLSDTVAATLRTSPRTAVVLAGGTPTLAESKIMGPAPFVAANVSTVTFTIPQPDTNYTVLLESPSIAEILGVTAKTTTSFDVEASAPLTGTARYAVVRDL